MGDYPGSALGPKYNHTRPTGRQAEGALTHTQEQATRRRDRERLEEAGLEGQIEAGTGQGCQQPLGAGRLLPFNLQVGSPGDTFSPVKLILGF